MRLTYVPAGTPGKRPVRFSQVPPSFRVSQTLPSSVPAYSRPGRIGDSASDTMVQKVSAPVTSGVTPPVVWVLTRIFIVSRVVRSGEMGYRLSPRCVDFITLLAPAYSVVGLCADRKNGVFQFQRRSCSAESASCRRRRTASRVRCGP